jgi:hypothetical protein
VRPLGAGAGSFEVTDDACRVAPIHDDHTRYLPFMAVCG